MNSMLELANHIVAASRQSADDHAKNPSIHPSSVPSVPSVSSVLKNPEPRTINPEPESGVDLADIFENLELQLEHAQSMAEGSPNIFLKASMNIASMEMFSVLNRFDTVTLSKRLEEKPELYFQMLNSQCALMKAHLDQQKLEFKQKQAKAKQRERQQKLRAQKPIRITTATLNALDQTLHRSRRHEEPELSPVGNPEPSIITSNTGSTDAINVAYQEPPRTTDNEPLAGRNREPQTELASHIVAASRRSAADQPPINHGRPVANNSRLTTDNRPLMTHRPRHSSRTPLIHPSSVSSVLKDPEPQTLNSEPCFEPAWSNAPPEDMVCCPS